MGSLVERLLAPERKLEVVREAVELVEAEVRAKGGLSGIALKSALKLVQAARGDFIPAAMERLLPSFAARLEPLYAERLGGAPTMTNEAYFHEHASRVAAALLSITDERARNSEGSGRRAAYEKIRPAAQRHVEEAAPRIGRLLDRHLA